ncbi:hypothetical protein JCM5353_007213 [Sporobolomyces roseus]
MILLARSYTGRLVQAGSAFQPVARANLGYLPSTVHFAPARLSASLGGGDQQREVVATSSECLRLWDLVRGDEGGGGGGGGGGFVGEGQSQQSRSILVSRATLQNSKADYSAPLTSFSCSVLELTHFVTSSADTVQPRAPAVQQSRPIINTDIAVDEVEPLSRGTRRYDSARSFQLLPPLISPLNIVASSSSVKERAETATSELRDCRF